LRPLLRAPYLLRARLRGATAPQAQPSWIAPVRQAAQQHIQPA